MSYETQSLYVYFLFYFLFWRFSLCSPLSVTLWLRYLQTCIKASCMYLSCQLFFKTPKKNPKIPTKTATADKKNISKHDRMEVFSTDIHWKKNHVCQQCTSYASAVRKEVGNIFLQSGDLNFIWLSFMVHICKMIISPGAFFIFSRIWFSRLSGK